MKRMRHCHYYFYCYYYEVEQQTRCRLHPIMLNVADRFRPVRINVRIMIRTFPLHFDKKKNGDLVQQMCVAFAPNRTNSKLCDRSNGGHNNILTITSTPNDADGFYAFPNLFSERPNTNSTVLVMYDRALGRRTEVLGVFSTNIVLRYCVFGFAHKIDL